MWGLQRKARSAERLQAEKRAHRFPPAYIRDRSQAAQSLAVPPAATVLADSFAKTSQRSWSRSDPWPRTQCHFVSCWPATDANSSHKSRFAMASPRLLHQPKLRQRTRYTVIPCCKYWESVITVTLHASVRALSPVPSVQGLCERLGITVGFMNKYFPAVRRAIAKEHRRWVSSATARRREKPFLDIRNIAAALQDRGFYPPVNKIVERFQRDLAVNGRPSPWRYVRLKRPSASRNRKPKTHWQGPFRPE